MKKIIILFTIMIISTFIFSADINVNGYTLNQYNASHSFTLPDVTIPGGWYMIIARDVDQAGFESEWGSLPSNVIFVNSGNAVPQINGDETFSLYDNNSSIVDTTYHLLTSGYSAQRDSNNVNTWTEVDKTLGNPGSGAVGNYGVGLIITEFSDAVDYNNEFVEIYNDTGTGGALNSPPTINSLNHSPSTVHQGDNVTVIANITDDSGIAFDTLFFYNSSTSIWTSIQKDSISGSDYYYSLGNFNLNDTIQYYVKAIDDSNAVTISDTNQFVIVPELDIVINEFCNDGPTGDDTSGEWIELYNSGSSSIDISGFIVSDGEGSFHIPSSTILNTNEFYVCMNNYDSFSVYYTIPGGVGYFPYADSVTGSFLLSNSGDNIELFDADSNQIDYVNYGSTGTNPAPDPGDSLSSIRTPDGQDTDICSDDFIATSTPSPGASNVGASGPTLSNLSRNIIVPTSSENLTITITATDADGIKEVNLITSAYDSTDIDTYSMINTSGDDYSITIPSRGDGCRFEYFVFAIDSVNDTSYSSDNGKFFWGITSIPKLKETDSNGFPRYYNYQIRATGIVTTNTGTYSTTANIINFQENYTLGAVIKIDTITTAETVAIGDSIFAEGTIGNWNGQTRIQPPYSKITNISSNHFIDTLYIESADGLMDTVGETYEGLLIQIDCHGLKSGTWPGPDTSALLVMNDTTTPTKAGAIDTFLMFVDNDTDIDGQTEPSWNERIVGIVTQFDVSSPYYSMYEILPRAYTDLTTGIATNLQNTFFNITIENGFAKLQWHSSISNILTYRIERRENNTKSYKILAKLDGNSCSYTDRTYSMQRNYEYRILGITSDGHTIEFKPIKIKSIISGFDATLNKNIVKHIAWIKLSIPQRDNVKIHLYNSSGRIIKTLKNEILNTGYYNLLVDLRDLPTGTYFIKINYGNTVKAEKIAIIK